MENFAEEVALLSKSCPLCLSFTITITKVSRNNIHPDSGLFHYASKCRQFVAPLPAFTACALQSVCVWVGLLSFDICKVGEDTLLEYEYLSTSLTHASIFLTATRYAFRLVNARPDPEVEKQETSTVPL